MRRIKSLLKKYKNGTITEEENLFLEYLMIDQLERMVFEENLSEEEMALLEDWKREREFLKDTERITLFTPAKIEQEALASWRSFSEKMNIPFPQEMPDGAPQRVVPEKETRRPHPFRRYITVASSLAAAIALLITVGLTLFTGGDTPMPQTEKIQTSLVLSQRIVSKNTIRKITLVDGTVVYMNQDTRLSFYKGKINAHLREVWLDEGEAFFEVAKDANRPFIVHTPDGLTTRVLGTSFNIKAYAQLGKQVISVKTGRVQVSRGDKQTVLLNPDNKAQFDKKRATLTAGLTNGKDAAAWRTGTIVLQDAGLDELALRLQQIYGVRLENQNNAINPNLLLHTSFDARTPLKAVVNRIARIYDIKYKEKNGKIIFYSK